MKRSIIEPRGLSTPVEMRIHDPNSVLKMRNYETDDICNEFSKQGIEREVYFSVWNQNCGVFKKAFLSICIVVMEF